MPTIDQILLLLKDSKWHNLDEITQKVEVPHAKLEPVVNFLTEYDFVQLDPTLRKVKLTPQLRKFLTELEQIEQEIAQ